MLILVREGEELDSLHSLVPLVEHKVARAGETTAYVCEAGVCERPTTDPAVFAEQIARVVPYPGL